MEKSKRDELEAIRWERSTSGFEATMLKYSARTLLPLGTGSSALDIGCNDGLFTKEICRCFRRVLGIDASSLHIERARLIAPEAELRVALVEEFDPGDELFDTVYMLDLLEHLDEPVEVLKRVKSWLSPHGYVIIQVPNAVSLNRRIGQKMGLISDLYELTPQDIEVGHKRFYDLESLKQDILASGLNVESMGGIFLKPFSNPQMEWFIKSEAWTGGLRGWGGEDKTIDWREKLCDALYEMAKELPQYCSAIWARCMK